MLFQRKFVMSSFKADISKGVFQVVCPRVYVKESLFDVLSIWVCQNENVIVYVECVM